MTYGINKTRLLVMSGLFAITKISMGAITLDDFTQGAAPAPENLNDFEYVNLYADWSVGYQGKSQSGLNTSSVIGGYRYTEVTVNRLAGGSALYEPSASASLKSYGENPGMDVSLVSAPAELDEWGAFGLSYTDSSFSTSNSNLSLNLLEGLGVSSSSQLKFTVSLADVVTVGAGTGFYTYLELRARNDSLNSEQLFMSRFVTDTSATSIEWGYDDILEANPAFDFTDVDSISLSIAGLDNEFSGETPFEELSFTITDFSVAAVPESSTYGALLGLIVLGIIFTRKYRL